MSPRAALPPPTTPEQLAQEAHAALALALALLNIADNARARRFAWKAYGILLDVLDQVATPPPKRLTEEP
jgi:hypothetical protein